MTWSGVCRFFGQFLFDRCQTAVFSRSIQSFCPSCPQLIIEFDASLTGGGVIWFGQTGAEDEGAIGASSVDFSDLALESNAKFQNYAEFSAALIGLIGQYSSNLI
jgi:hypothetical protein